MKLDGLLQPPIRLVLPLPSALFGSRFAGGRPPKTPESLESKLKLVDCVNIPICPGNRVSGLYIVKGIPPPPGFKVTLKLVIAREVAPVLSIRTAPASSVCPLGV